MVSLNAGIKIIAKDDEKYNIYPTQKAPISLSLVTAMIQSQTEYNQHLS